ncbi:MAG: hypothetical protein RLY71_4267, partial [Pseudomonadota bacterium]
MLRLSLRVKLQLVAILLVVPMLALLLVVAVHQRADLTTVQAEQAGVELVNASLDVVKYTMAHRGQTNMLLGGDQGVRQALDATRAKLRDTMAALDQRVQAHPELGLQPIWQALQSRLVALGRGEHPPQPAQAFRLHSEAVEDLRRFIDRS